MAAQLENDKTEMKSELEEERAVLVRQHEDNIKQLTGEYEGMLADHLSTYEASLNE